MNERTNERTSDAIERVNERMPIRSNQHLFCQSVIWRCLWQQWQTVISTKNNASCVRYIYIYIPKQSFSLGDLFACICAAYFQSPHHYPKSGRVLYAEQSQKHTCFKIYIYLVCNRLKYIQYYFMCWNNAIWISSLGKWIPGQYIVEPVNMHFFLVIACGFFNVPRDKKKQQCNSWNIKGIWFGGMGQ